MARITVLGGTGYAGNSIAREAAGRGHEVVAVSRSAPTDPIPGVRYTTASVEDPATLEALAREADVVVAALSPRGDMESKLVGVYAQLARACAAAGTRLGVVGGWSALRAAEGGPRIAYGPDVPAAFAVEARAMADVAEHLTGPDAEGLDWFYVSPPQGYGAWVPGEPTGRYRVSGDVALFTEPPTSISGADFALAIVDEIDNPQHRRAQFSVRA